MGIDKSDSLWYTFQKYDDPQADSDLVNKTFAALEFNKWYKCAIEYDFSAQKLTYYLRRLGGFHTKRSGHQKA